MVELVERVKEWFEQGKKLEGTEFLDFTDEISQLRNVIEECIQDEELQEKIRDRTSWCTGCHRKVDLTNVETFTDTYTENNVTVQSDCGYGDDDILASLIYTNRYYKCPYCNEVNHLEFVSVEEVPGTRHKRK